MPSISIIGTGKAARFFAKRFFNAGITVQAIAGRNEERTIALAGEVNATAIAYHPQIVFESDILLLAVPDGKIDQVAGEQQHFQGTVIHCSGSAGIDPISYFPGSGVIWPVYSLQEDVYLRTDIPLVVQGPEQVSDLAKAISSAVYPLDENQRRQLHLAATMVNNFTHFMLLRLQQYLGQQHTPIAPLQAILEQTAQLAGKNLSEQSLTGPAQRNDQITIQSHLAHLQSEKALLSIYELFTALIRGDIK